MTDEAIVIIPPLIVLVKKSCRAEAAAGRVKSRAGARIYAPRIRALQSREPRSHLVHFRIRVKCLQLS